MKCKEPMRHRPAMEGVINCKKCERDMEIFFLSWRLPDE